jgi:hypothetical protein
VPADVWLSNIAMQRRLEMFWRETSAGAEACRYWGPIEDRVAILGEGFVAAGLRAW